MRAARCMLKLQDLDEPTVTAQDQYCGALKALAKTKGKLAAWEVDVIGRLIAEDPATGLRRTPSGRPAA